MLQDVDVHVRGQDVDVIVRVQNLHDLNIDLNVLKLAFSFSKQLSRGAFQVSCSPYHASNDSNITREGVLFFVHLKIAHLHR